MIHVIATIELVEGSREEFLSIFRNNIPKVKAEKGCMSYTPTIDVDSGIPIQDPLRDNAVTIIGTWESLEALHAHLKAPHMAEYREAVKDLVKKLSLQVFKPAA